MSAQISNRNCYKFHRNLLNIEVSIVTQDVMHVGRYSLNVKLKFFSRFHNFSELFDDTSTVYSEFLKEVFNFYD